MVACPQQFIEYVCMCRVCLLSLYSCISRASRRTHRFTLLRSIWADLDTKVRASAVPLHAVAVASVVFFVLWK